MGELGNLVIKKLKSILGTLKCEIKDVVIFVGMYAPGSGAGKGL
jgi:hypothetical protein